MAGWGRRSHSGLLATGSQMASLQVRAVALRLGARVVLVGGLFVGLIFLLVALTLWLAPRLGPAVATAAVGGGIIVVAAILAGIVALLGRSAARRARRAREPLLMTIPVLGGLRRLSGGLRGTRRARSTEGASTEDERGGDRQKVAGRGRGTTWKLLLAATVAGAGFELFRRR